MTAQCSRRFASLVLFASLLAFVPPATAASPAGVDPVRLDGFDAYMEKLLHDWNVPGIGVAIVVKDQVVLAKGWGYRDYGKKLPFTPQTVVPIASNTKLFTAVATGTLVEEPRVAPRHRWVGFDHERHLDRTDKVNKIYSVD